VAASHGAAGGCELVGPEPSVDDGELGMVVVVAPAGAEEAVVVRLDVVVGAGEAVGGGDGAVGDTVGGASVGRVALSGIVVVAIVDGTGRVVVVVAGARLDVVVVAVDEEPPPQATSPASPARPKVTTMLAAAMRRGISVPSRGTVRRRR
jgi:hypothetical protein